MKITRKDVQHVAALAHLELSPAELERMERQLDAILGYIEKLNELDTAGVAPMAQVLSETPTAAAMRADKQGACLTREEALAAAPDADRAFVKVPKVIDR